MAITGNYNICITAQQDRFMVKPEDLSRLIDYLDTNLYLDGPDRDVSRLVLGSFDQQKYWEPFARQSQNSPIEYLRRKNVHVLYSPVAPEETFKNYNELLLKLDSLLPRDKSLIASLGYTTRKFFDIIYCPVESEEKRWITTMTVHLIQGYHPIWQRVIDNDTGFKEWQLIGVKGFIFMISCKLNSSTLPMPVNDLINKLYFKPEFIRFLSEVGNIIGTKELELLGSNTDIE